MIGQFDECSTAKDSTERKINLGEWLLTSQCILWNYAVVTTN
jgi:hypothetical protein